MTLTVATLRIWDHNARTQKVPKIIAQSISKPRRRVRPRQYSIYVGLKLAYHILTLGFVYTIGLHGVFGMLFLIVSLLLFLEP